jgi:peptidoglycan/LPS O-acetylase OafA/YrhL
MGTYRLLLAYCVVIEHVATGHQALSHTGMFAVEGFYVLSGFLITKILNEVYHFEWQSFWINRFLRLYPQYLLLLAFGSLLLAVSPSTAAFFPAVWSKPPDFEDWLGLLLVAPMGVAPMTWQFRPVPSIWSVAVELLNYAILFLVTARSAAPPIAMTGLAVAFHLFGLWYGLDLAQRYFPFYAALLPFSVGALLYFILKRYPLNLSRGGRVLFCLPALINLVVAGVLGGTRATYVFEGQFYLNIGLQALAIAALANITPERGAPLDKLLGNLSYPVFLSHWLVAYLLYITLIGGEPRGIVLMLATLAGATVAAYALCSFQSLIEPLRNRIRYWSLIERPITAGGEVLQRAS